ncbi:lysosomal acid glucosylceramidase-like [Ostrinia furnacalis]|uniref:lysosomal acid glucosylceramidase-like n=1 Tax=Ostrinia furnacalis TaxID=93504 RepID=UPI00103C2628|nr:lysosomal acid glucosylceramidase-like [Ostrinia furnacalis]
METRLGLFVIVLLVSWTTIKSEDKPCRVRETGIEGRSILCVCDANYCDTITREEPTPGGYVMYTSSQAGQRFEKFFGELEDMPTPTTPEPTTEPAPEEEEEVVDENRGYFMDDEDDSEDAQQNATLFNTVNLRAFTNTQFQKIEGFGGSVTDAAAINWRKLSDAAQTQMVNTYFGPEGIEYNLIRTHIGGADFSTHPYTLNDYPWHDAGLTNFSLTSEDYFYKLPMLLRCIRAATTEVKNTASTWSPPVWMKTNERITGFGQLRTQYYQAFADYHIRFLEEYEKAGVKFWAITTTNEPINGIVPLAPFNSLGWLPSQMARWVANNLGPTLRNSRFNETLLLAVDDQRYLLHFYMVGIEREDPRALDYIDGIAIHYYGNFFPPAILRNLQNRYPDKMLLSTEACEGPMPWDLEKVELGSWRRARRYITSILEDLNHDVVGWIDWNLCLDPTGGPNWANNFVDAPILVYAENDEFVKQPMYYAMGHFSKFIPRGSRRILVSRSSIFQLEHLAVMTPQGNMVMVIQNRFHREMNVNVQINTRLLAFRMEPRSVKTIEINLN